MTTTTPKTVAADAVALAIAAFVKNHGVTRIAAKPLPKRITVNAKNRR